MHSFCSNLYFNSSNSRLKFDSGFVINANSNVCITIGQSLSVPPAARGSRPGLEAGVPVYCVFGGRAAVVDAGARRRPCCVRTWRGRARTATRLMRRAARMEPRRAARLGRSSSAGARRVGGRRCDGNWTLVCHRMRDTTQRPAKHGLC